MMIEMRDILPEVSHTGSKIIVEEKEETIIVYWKNKARHPKPSEIPKKLLLTEELLALMGFWLGDGLKSRNGGSLRTVAFTNSEPRVVKWAMRLFEIFKISKEDLYASVTVRTVSEVNVEEIKQFWSETTGIPQNRISVNLRKSTRKNLRKLAPPRKFGSIKVEFHSAVLRDIVISLLEFCKKMALRREEYAISFLKGLLTADGSTILSKRARYVVICSTNETNKKFIKQLLEAAKISSKERKDGIEIREKAELLKLKEFNIFELHPERNAKFMKFFTF